MAPKRIQRSRKKGSKLPPGTVSVCRPGKYGNPYRVGWWINPRTLEQFPHWQKWTRRIDVALALRLFRDYALIRLADEPEWLEPLRGKNLACFCGESMPCHGDVILELANKGK